MASVAETISHCLVAEGVKLAAGMSGQQIGPLLDQIAGRTEIALMYARQERVAFDICDGYARATGNPGVVFTDSGPAAANLMCGLVNSWGDSIPVIFFAGHNDQSEIASGQTKEIPFVDLFGPVSKWATIISDPSQTLDVMRRAFMHMRTGRPGPVCIGLPFDIAKQDVADTDYTPVSSQPRIRSAGDPAQIQAAVDIIAAAQRPYVYVGAGVLFSEATDVLVNFADCLSLPVATTLNGKSAFPENHDLSLGIGGFARAAYSSLPATKLAENADVILTIGCGFKRHATRVRPDKQVRHVQIDIDPKELNRDHLADIAILGDARIILQQMTDAAENTLGQDRLQRVGARYDDIGKLKAQWSDVSQPLLTSAEVPINPFRVTAELMKVADPAKTILLHDAGTVRGTTSQHYMAPTPRSFLGFGVQSAMGWSTGAAMGAKKAFPEKLVVTVIGEEAFNETALDIETSIRNDAPILVIVKNNRKYADTDGGNSQRLAYTRFHQGMNIGPLVEAMGGRAYRVEQPDQLANILSGAIDTVMAGKTAVVEVLTTRVNASLHSLWEN
jgi:acetolactate synthase-1/2/3 large subunit